MKVHLIKKLTIEDFVAANPASRIPFQDWLGKLKYADWENPSDMQSTFGSADLLGKSSNRVIFDIGGNNYRMICKYAFGENQVHLFVCWIGTHTDYDKLCKKEEQYTINLF
ncbi:MAG: type II toxin-antitoxin system HigB family toxin [Sphingobacteriales bacterium]